VSEFQSSLSVFKSYQLQFASISVFQLFQSFITTLFADDAFDQDQLVNLFSHQAGSQSSSSSE